jgi:hypothetical protein
MGLLMVFDIIVHITNCMHVDTVIYILALVPPAGNLVGRRAALLLAHGPFFFGAAASFGGFVDCNRGAPLLLALAPSACFFC